MHGGAGGGEGAAATGDRAFGGFEARDVCTRGEGFSAMALDGDDADVRVGVMGEGRFGDRRPHRVGDGVVAVRVVDGDGADGAVALRDDPAVAAHAWSPVLVPIMRPDDGRRRDGRPHLRAALGCRSCSGP